MGPRAPSWVETPPAVEPRRHGVPAQRWGRAGAPAAWCDLIETSGKIAKTGQLTAPAGDCSDSPADVKFRSVLRGVGGHAGRHRSFHLAHRSSRPATSLAGS